MNRRYALFLGGVCAIVLGCEAWVRVSASGASCAGAETQAGSGPSLGQVPLLEIGGVLLIAWTARLIWLWMCPTVALRSLPHVANSVALTEAIQRTGVQRTVCLDSTTAQAFCAGSVRPRIFVTHGLIDRFGPSELDAVLLHEEQRRRYRDPLRYLLRRASADVFFFLPMVAWWTDYAGQSAELRADRTVLAHLGSAPLAGALWAATSDPSRDWIPSFHGSAEVRVAQLLGDPIPRRTPSPRILGTSLLGVVLVVQFSWCLAAVSVLLQHAGA